MRQTNFGNLSVLQFDIFRKDQTIKHCVTTKEGWQTGNLPRFSKSENQPWKEYRKELAKSLNISTDQLYIPKQTHSDLVIAITKGTKEEVLAGVDALITNEKECCLIIQTADCVPILLYDPIDKAIGVVHAGWRGTVAKLVQKTIRKMSIEYNCNPANIQVGIGPSIYKHAYEVGEEVITRVIDVFADYKSLLSASRRDGQAFFDLWEANKIVLIESGISEENIETMGMCSYQLDQLFFSARREGIETGRMVSCLMLK